MAQEMVRHRQLIKTNAEWVSSGLILLYGELGYASDTKIVKVGDGVNTWQNLPNLNAAYEYDAANRRLKFV